MKRIIPLILIIFAISCGQNKNSGKDINSDQDTTIMSAQSDTKALIRDKEAFSAPQGGDVIVTMINHGSIALTYKDLEIQVDPVINYYGNTIDYSGFPKADLILVTHDHEDHMDPQAVKELSKEGTVIISNASAAKSLPGAVVMKNGDTKDACGITIKALPAYNTTEGHLKFHPKGVVNAYLLSIGGLNIFIGGDTEDIPEFANLKDIDIAFLPTNQPYTMTVDQCISAAKTIKPKILIPYHLGDTDIQAIKTGLEGSGIKVSLHESLR